MHGRASERPKSGVRAEHATFVGSRARQLVADLTERETEVLTCLGEGLSNAQIGARLFLTEATVKGYVSRLLLKLDCANRTQAGLLAYDAGLVTR